MFRLAPATLTPSPSLESMVCGWAGQPRAQSGRCFSSILGAMLMACPWGVRWQVCHDSALLAPWPIFAFSFAFFSATKAKCSGPIAPRNEDTLTKVHFSYEAAWHRFLKTRPKRPVEGAQPFPLTTLLRFWSKADSLFTKGLFST